MIGEFVVSVSGIGVGSGWVLRETCRPPHRRFQALSAGLRLSSAAKETPAMTNAYADEIRARFGIDLDLGEGEVPDGLGLRRLLMRRTQRRYDPRPAPARVVRML